MSFRIKYKNLLLWLLDPICDDPDFFTKKWFGCDAACLNGRVVAVLADGEEPWNGLLVPTFREQHASLRNDFPALQIHEILGKWLYLSQTDPAFEETATSVIESIRRRDPRIGVEPKPRKKKRINL